MVGGGLGIFINIYYPNYILSTIIGLVITSPILFADYIALYLIGKYKKNKKIERRRIKQEKLDNLGDYDYEVVLCPNCGNKNLRGTTHCNNCGKDLRIITW